MSAPMLTEQDVERLLTDPSANNRAETVAKVAQIYDPEKLTDAERKMAEEIFHVMVQDAEVRVRQALAVNVKENPFLPQDVALALARDVDDVSLPILEFSKVLSDADLVEIIREADTAKLTAIAGRESVSEQLSDALVGTGNEEAVGRLVANDGADISEKSFQKVIDDFGDKESIQNSLVGRKQLPVTIAERLVTVVSESLRDQLVTRHELSPDLAADLLMQSRERATIGLSKESDEGSVERLVEQLHEHGRLTPSIILRSVCMGDMSFFEYSMAKLVGIPITNARTLIHDSGHLGLSRLFKEAKLPEHLFPAIRAAIDVERETDYDGGENDRERYTRRMIERILTQYGDLGVKMESGDLEYLLAKMSQLPAEEVPAN